MALSRREVALRAVTRFVRDDRDGVWRELKRATAEDLEVGRLRVTNHRVQFTVTGEMSERPEVADLDRKQAGAGAPCGLGSRGDFRSSLQVQLPLSDHSRDA